MTAHQTLHRRALIFALLVLLSVPVLGIDLAAAQDEPGVHVGVVDRQKILRESKAGQGVRTEFEATEKAYRGEISDRENDLRAQQEELKRQRAILTPEAYAAREAEFSKKVEQLQRDVKARNKELEKMLSYGMKQIDIATVKIIAEIAEERGYTLVLDKTQLLLVSKSYEFSGDVIERLDERLPSVSTSPPETEETQ